jgi:hypothetical protein
MEAVSDTWYRKRLDLPPYEDGLGHRWTFEGECLNPAEREPNWLDEWPEDLKSVAFQAAVNMELRDSFFRKIGL